MPVKYRRVKILNKKQRVPIPNDIKAKLMLYTRYECCLCDAKISGKRESNIHHVNGDSSDNRMENLIPLCPNCHVRADRGDYSENHLKEIKEVKIRKLGIRKDFEEATEPTVAFKTLFSSKLDQCLRFIKEETYSNQFNDIVDELIMLVKERIEKWDVPSIRFSTKELFQKLYKYSGKDGFCDLYVIYEDLFKYAYVQRKHILGVMIEVLFFILFESWVPEYDIKKGEKASEVLLRLGCDFLNKDLAVTESCFTCIDNLAGDMFEPEILSKEIIFGAYVFEQKSRDPALKEFLERIVESIQINDQYACDDENYAYLIDSIKYAMSEQNKYSTNIEDFKNQYLLPIAKQNIDKRVKDPFLRGS